MDGMEMAGTPWMPSPVQLHAYREYECSQNTTAECEYYQGYWRFWYEADHRFALPTVAFFTAAIFLFALAHMFQRFAPELLLHSRVVGWKTALYRYLSYRIFRMSALSWNSAPLGVLALGVIGTIFFMCLTLAPKPYYWPSSTTTNYWGGSPPLATRSGWLSLGCMPFVFLTAGKSNFITAVTGVSYEKLQVFHRWISYAFFATALMHTFPFIVYNIQTHQMVAQWMTNFDYWTGVVALFAQTWLTFASIGPLRNKGYEWFKFSHFVTALVFVVFLFFHCGYTLSSWDYFIVTGVFFAFSWLHRQWRTYFVNGVYNYASISLTSNGFICVRIPTTAVWGAGQHFFVRFMTFGIHAFSIHPFTACSLPSQSGPNSELMFYIQPKTGLTARLAQQAALRPGSTVRVLLDGPYGGVSLRKMQQSKRQVVIAGGAGAGWVLPMLTTRLRNNDPDQKEARTMGLDTMKIILATRDTTTRRWFQQAVTELLAEGSLDLLPATFEVEIYYTGPETPKFSEQYLQTVEDAKTVVKLSQPSSRNGSDPSGFKHFDGRPDLIALLRSEIASAPTEQLGIFVCGPLSMQNAVSNVVANAQVEIMKGASKDVYLHMEHFAWA